jgi:2,3,4,5-tetrahydropyridine-2-carboxylate N-succinyltransferase
MTNDPERLRREVERLGDGRTVDAGAARVVVAELLGALEAGVIRAAEPDGDGWRVNGWVKAGILLAFRVGRNAASRAGEVFFFRDRDTFPTWDPTSCDRNVRLVPGGTTVRRGAHLGDGVVVMPPAYVNVGAYVGQGAMIDSHALVGSCAQVGRNVHLSAAAQLGGVLEPIGAMPVIVEDDAFVGGGAGIYEGVRVGRGAVVAPGVILSRSVALYDLAAETVHRATADSPLIVPEGAVVVAGSRPARGEFARKSAVQLATPVIVKYRDSSTDSALALEEALR